MYDSFNKQETTSDLDMMEYVIIFLLYMSATKAYIFLLQILLFLEGNVMHGICQNASLFYGNEAMKITVFASEGIDLVNLKKCL